jgi:hypothetical protein
MDTAAPLVTGPELVKQPAKITGKWRGRGSKAGLTTGRRILKGKGHETTHHHRLDPGA